jgi:hypothetical protein
MLFPKKKTVSYEDYKKLKKWYREELLRKDKEIQSLREEKQALLNSALEQSRALVDLHEKKTEKND